MVFGKSVKGLLIAAGLLLPVVAMGMEKNQTFWMKVGTGAITQVTQAWMNANKSNLSNVTFYDNEKGTTSVDQKSVVDAFTSQPVKFVENKETPKTAINLSFIPRSWTAFSSVKGIKAGIKAMWAESKGQTIATFVVATAIVGATVYGVYKAFEYCTDSYKKRTGLKKQLKK